jgi:hypothetical protein
MAARAWWCARQPSDLPARQQLLLLLRRLSHDQSRSRACARVCVSTHASAVLCVL